MGSIKAKSGSAYVKGTIMTSHINLIQCMARYPHTRKVELFGFKDKYMVNRLLYRRCVQFWPTYHQTISFFSYLEVTMVGKDQRVLHSLQVWETVGKFS